METNPLSRWSSDPTLYGKGKPFGSGPLESKPLPTFNNLSVTNAPLNGDPHTRSKTEIATSAPEEVKSHGARSIEKASIATQTDTPTSEPEGVKSLVVIGDTLVPEEDNSLESTPLNMFTSKVIKERLEKNTIKALNLGIREIKLIFLLMIPFIVLSATVSPLFAIALPLLVLLYIACHCQIKKIATDVAINKTQEIFPILLNGFLKSYGASTEQQRAILETASTFLEKDQSYPFKEIKQEIFNLETQVHLHHAFKHQLTNSKNFMNTIIHDLLSNAKNDIHDKLKTIILKCILQLENNNITLNKTKKTQAILSFVNGYEPENLYDIFIGGVSSKANASKSS